MSSNRFCRRPARRASTTSPTFQIEGSPTSMPHAGPLYRRDEDSPVRTLLGRRARAADGYGRSSHPAAPLTDCPDSKDVD
ncbi:hypothetical protein EVAR_21905_1 [Eumeta japonica]|uniref:Uncharacterized protein n=1 Tax=Eumeta variegata TaxID=151549 RepID=A0A4C1XH81_EUMVA|nr:hypothetical protein EVAR_21905_1 [Eumeta japonica]